MGFIMGFIRSLAAQNGLPLLLIAFSESLKAGQAKLSNQTISDSTNHVFVSYGVLFFFGSVWSLS